MQGWLGLERRISGWAGRRYEGDARMSEFNFTEGPWELEETEDGHVIRMGKAIESHGNFPSHMEIEYNHGCLLDGEEGDVFSEAEIRQAKEALANAQLITASPEMHEALKLYEELESELLMENSAWVNGLPKFTQSLYDKWVEIQGKRNEVLAKAEGNEA